MIDQLLRGPHHFEASEYESRMTLDQEAAEAGARLEPIRQSLRVMGAGLQQTSLSLGDAQSGQTLMGDRVIHIRQNVIDAEVAIISHQTTLEQLKKRVRVLRRDVSCPTPAIAWVVSLILIWIGLSQLAILRWGIGLWQRRRCR